MADFTHQFDSSYDDITITIHGEVAPGDAGRLGIYADQLLISRPSRIGDYGGVTLSFDSTGGHHLEGIEIGKLLWERGYGSLVKANAVCYSAAAFAYLGGAFHYMVGGSGPGRMVEAGARMGFHSFYNDSLASVPTRFGVQQGKYLSTVLADYATSCHIDMRFIIESLWKPPHEFIELRTVDHFRRLGIQVYGLQPMTHLTDVGAVYAANYATGWQRPIALAPQAGETLAEIQRLSAADYRRDALDRISKEYPRRRREASTAGPIATLIRQAVATASDDEIFALYKEAARFGIVPFSWPNDSDRVLHITGFEYGAGFYTAEAFVMPSHEGSPRLGVAVVLVSTINQLSAVDFRRSGDVLFQVRSPTEVLW